MFGAFGVRMYPTTVEEHYLMCRRAGYPEEGTEVIFGSLSNPNRTHCDPYEWNDRTFHVAHRYIRENWEKLTSGQVVDVGFILGETPRPKVSERLSFFPEDTRLEEPG